MDNLKVTKVLGLQINLHDNLACLAQRKDKTLRISRVEERLSTLNLQVTNNVKGVDLPIVELLLQAEKVDKPSHFSMFRSTSQAVPELHSAASI